MYNSFSLLAATAIFVVTSLLTSSATAEITIVDFTDDATSGISSSNTYTHAVDFGIGNSPATVNGVAFTFFGRTYNDVWGDVNTTSTASTYNAYNAVGALDNSSTPTTGRKAYSDAITYTGGPGVQEMLRDFVYVPAGGAGVIGSSLYQVITLNNLTVGQKYDFRVYYRSWAANATRSVNLSFGYGDAFSETTTIDEDAGAKNNTGHYASFVYTATDTTFALATAANALGHDWHLYGITNQVVPESSTITLANSNFNFETGVFSLTWTSSDIKNYRITSSTDLLDWSNVIVDNIPGQAAQATTTYTGTFTQGVKAFFRVEEIP